ncbi:hypothetical protein HUS23_05880 [Ectothiorhodospiraceae bacterium 2226]|nr:hypothetical protein HUS23_05880 [Ectothiorhodospiraceae bacterium 2226]
MTHITLSAEAREWILANRGSVTLRASPRHGCAGGHAAVPVATLGAPEASEDYARTNIDGVDVFVARALEGEPYRITLEGLWGWQRLGVEGALSTWRRE